MVNLFKRALIDPNSPLEFAILTIFYLVVSFCLVTIVTFVSTLSHVFDAVENKQINSIITLPGLPFIAPEENTNFEDYKPEPLPFKKFWV